MRNILFAFILFFLGFTGIVSIRYFQMKYAPPFIPQTSTFTFKPPSQALSGTLTSTNGHVERLSRGENEFKEASEGATILLGESIVTKAQSQATVTIVNLATIKFGPAAEVNFANLFVDNTLLQQKSGKVQYVISKPIGVRALHALVSIASGTTIINIIDTDISVTVKSGSAKLALVDTDNNTLVWNLKEGQRANIDDTARTVYLVRQR